MNDERVALITGGAGGLGVAIATRLSEDGSTVVLVDLDGDAAQRQAASISSETGGAVLGWAGDVSSDDDNIGLIKRVEDTFGRLDQLINNAARPERLPFGKLTGAEWASVMQVNTWGPASLCQAASRLWRDSDRGAAVVNIASRTWQSGGPLAYTSSKAAVVGLTRSLAIELGSADVRVNAVAPSFVPTSFGGDRPEGERDRYLEHHRQMSLLNRLATPHDIAEAVAFLASERASFITGEVLHVAGGAQLAPAP